MRFIDVVQFLSMALSFVAIGAWAIRLRKWPLAIAVAISMMSNIAFYFARSFNWLSPIDLNLFSSVRALLMVAIIAYIPFVIGRIK